jgi:uncharacterized lipoprotein YajG
MARTEWSFSRGRRWTAGAATAGLLAGALLLAGCTKSPDEVEASATAHLARNESRSAMVEL